MPETFNSNGKTSRAGVQEEKEDSGQRYQNKDKRDEVEGTEVGNPANRAHGRHRTKKVRPQQEPDTVDEIITPNQKTIQTTRMAIILKKETTHQKQVTNLEKRKRKDRFSKNGDEAPPRDT